MSKVRVHYSINTQLRTKFTRPTLLPRFCLQRIPAEVVFRSHPGCVREVEFFHKEVYHIF